MPTFRKHKENANGSDRGTQASAPDPGTSSFAISGSDLTGFYSHYIFSAAASPSLTPEKPKVELETVESDMPILAHRIARLRFDGTSKPFGPLHKGKPFGRDATAKCESDPWGITINYSFTSYGTGTSSPAKRHTAPAVDCGCGFYALPSDIEPWGEGHDYVTLMVELSGTVIEHEKGYRAGHQRVVECQIFPCRYCGRRSEVLDIRGGQMHSATCAAHVATVGDDFLGDGRVVLAAADLALPVPVVWQGIGATGVERASADESGNKP